MRYLIYGFKKHGFTLLELLVVTAILATIAGGLLLSMSHVQEDTYLKINQTEMLKIKQAILQFKQDTGYLPKQGPFALGINCVSPGDLNEEKFCSPVNMEQLYEEPLDVASRPIMPWNINTSRGWRGPYLTRHGEGVVDVGNDINPDQQGINGDPESGTLLLDVRGVADSFVTSRGVCPNVADLSRCFLGFSSVAAGETHARWGRPYLFFGLETPDNRDDDVIISMGANHIFDQGGVDDVVLELFR
jgi:prepilin-type N-terminal cleavage/methylation domain-containing protein